MNIEIGQVVQTKKYAKKNYLGRKMLIQKIQHDIEENNYLVIGPLLDKKCRQQKKIQAIKVKELIL